MRKYIILIICLVTVFLCAMQASATEVDATDITSDTTFSATGYGWVGFLRDKDIHTYHNSKGNTTITLENDAGMASLYLLFDLEYGAYTITDNTSGKTYTAGTNNFIHEYIDLSVAFGTEPTSVTLDFSSGVVSLSEIYVFSQGQVPQFVQKWEPPLDGCADILMMPTHGDDDHLYFAGLLPYYAGELDCAVQVAYLTNHRNDTTIRFHEILNGLWATGVENYPVFAFKWDFRVDPLKEAYRVFTNFGVSDEDLVGFSVEMFRRFKPQVVVAHDINGEYGHGMHKVYADIVIRGVELSNASDAFPDSAEKYGLWDVPKTYLHLLTDNPIVIDYDVPLDYFDGLTAFQATQKYGFPCHVSQSVYPAFGDWLYGTDAPITKATEIEKYNPAHFGLYRTTVGPDVQKNDFLENITTYAEQTRLEEERLEQEQMKQQPAQTEQPTQPMQTEQPTQPIQTEEPTQTVETEHQTISDEEIEQIINASRGSDFKLLLIFCGVVTLGVMGFKFAFRLGKNRGGKSSGAGKYQRGKNLRKK